MWRSHIFSTSHYRIWSIYWHIKVLFNVILGVWHKVLSQDTFFDWLIVWSCNMVIFQSFLYILASFRVWRMDLLARARDSLRQYPYHLWTLYQGTQLGLRDLRWENMNKIPFDNIPKTCKKISMGGALIMNLLVYVSLALPRFPYFPIFLVSEKGRFAWPIVCSGWLPPILPSLCPS